MSSGGSSKSKSEVRRELTLLAEESGVAGDVAEEFGDFGALAGRVEDSESEQIVASAMGFEGGEEDEGA